MHIGICHITLRLPENDTLKGKRRVISSLKSRVRSRFNVAIAEVEDNSRWQLITLGVSCVSNNAQHANEILSKVVQYINDIGGDTEFLDYDMEILHGL